LWQRHARSYALYSSTGPPLHGSAGCGWLVKVQVMSLTSNGRPAHHDIVARRTIAATPANTARFMAARSALRMAQAIPLLARPPRPARSRTRAPARFRASLPKLSWHRDRKVRPDEQHQHVQSSDERHRDRQAETFTTKCHVTCVGRMRWPASRSPLSLQSPSVGFDFSGRKLVLDDLHSLSDSSAL